MNLNPFQASFRARYLLGFVVCVALLAFAIFTQFQWGLEPCPLCIFQRIAFAALAIAFLVGGLHAPHGVGGRRGYGTLAVLAAVVGIGIAGRHVWLQLNPPTMPSCGPTFDFLRDTLDTTSLIRRVLQGSGDCGAVDWTFLGLSMPAWSLFWFIVLGLWAATAFSRRR